MFAASLLRHAHSDVYERFADATPPRHLGNHERRNPREWLGLEEQRRNMEGEQANRLSVILCQERRVRSSVGCQSQAPRDLLDRVIESKAPR